jgi:hypothetical protein
MRVFVFVILLLCNQAKAQDSWTEEEKRVLDRFGLRQDDPRGVIFWPSGDDCAFESHNDMRSALESFFTASMKKDLTEYCVSQLPEKMVGMPMDIHRVVLIYLTE